MTNELEPRGKLQGGIVEHSFQAIGGNVSSVADFVQIRFEVDVCFDEENVVDWLVTRGQYISFRE
jgi:hypothetical protein